MKISVNENNNIEFEEIYTPISFKTRDGETLAITMRDSGFEFFYQDEWYCAKNGKVNKYTTKYTKNIKI